MEKIRLNLSVDARVPDKLERLAGGRNRMGDWLSDLLLAMEVGDDTAAEIERLNMESLRLMIQGLAGRVRALEAGQDKVINSLTTLVLERCACCDEVGDASDRPGRRQNSYPATWAITVACRG